MPNRLELPHPIHVIQELEKNPQFRSELLGNNRARALGSLPVRTSVEAPKTNQEVLSSMMKDITMSLPGMIEGSQMLDKIYEDERYRGRRTDRRYKETHLRKVIIFNHNLREVADRFDDKKDRLVTPQYLLNYCTATALNLSGPETAQYVQQEVRERIVGMQHEIALEQIAYNVPGVISVDHASEDEELQGIDLLVNYKGEDLALDAKSSERGAAKSLIEREEYTARNRLSVADTNAGGYPVWTAVNYEEFKGGFHLEQDSIDKHTPTLHRTLEMLYVSRHKQAPHKHRLA